MTPNTPSVDPVAMRSELALRNPADIESAGFLRFVIRLSERLNFDIPREDFESLSTEAGSVAYVALRVGHSSSLG